MSRHGSSRLKHIVHPMSHHLRHITFYWHVVNTLNSSASICVLPLQTTMSLRNSYCNSKLKDLLIKSFRLSKDQHACQHLAITEMGDWQSSVFSDQMLWLHGLETPNSLFQLAFIRLLPQPVRRLAAFPVDDPRAFTWEANYLMTDHADHFPVVSALQAASLPWLEPPQVAPDSPFPIVGIKCTPHPTVHFCWTKQLASEFLFSSYKLIALVSNGEHGLLPFGQISMYNMIIYLLWCTRWFSGCIFILLIFWVNYLHYHYIIYLHCIWV